MRNLKKPLVYHLSVTLLALFYAAFSLGQEVISSQGDSYSNSNFSTDFTIGEVVINTETDNNNDITQGFHQTNWVFVGIEDFIPTIEIKVYPNPVKEQLFIETNNFENTNYVIYDVTGKVIVQGKLSTVKTYIETSGLPPSFYSLVIQNQKNETLKIFKLIKTH